MKLLTLLILPCFLFSVEEYNQKDTKQQQELQNDNPYRERVTPEEIESELVEAEEQFDNALELFNPWYTGPLITSSASLMPMGSAMIQPYIYFTDYYGFYNEDRKEVSTPDKFQLLAQPIIFQTGVAPTIDATLVMSALGNWQQGESGGGFSDISASLGFQIIDEGLYRPKAKFTISESFPTGTYQKLNTNGLALSATGSGCWGTNFALAVGKLFFWNTKHPFNTRAVFSYKVNTPVHVKGFNAYGGGFGTNGTVHPGNIINVDVGFELSINQPWVVALDVAYVCQNRTTFSGNPGVTSTGAPASVGGGFSDQLSLAPAVEYNFNGEMGLLGGAWFSVYGRNSSAFATIIFSWYWQFI